MKANIQFQFFDCSARSKRMSAGRWVCFIWTMGSNPLIKATARRFSEQQTWRLLCSIRWLLDGRWAHCRPVWLGPETQVCVWLCFILLTFYYSLFTSQAPVWDEFGVIGWYEYCHRLVSHSIIIKEHLRSSSTALKWQHSTYFLVFSFLSVVWVSLYLTLFFTSCFIFKGLPSCGFASCHHYYPTEFSYALLSFSLVYIFSLCLP